MTDDEVNSFHALIQAHLDSQKPCEHCWHLTGIVIDTWPEQREMVCCLCDAGTLFEDPVPSQRDIKHGPHERWL